MSLHVCRWPLMSVNVCRSLSTSSMVFGTALGPFLVGQILDLNISYNIILFSMSILSIVSSISLFITMSKVPNLK